MGVGVVSSESGKTIVDWAVWDGVPRSDGIGAERLSHSTQPGDDPGPKSMTSCCTERRRETPEKPAGLTSAESVQGVGEARRDRRAYTYPGRCNVEAPGGGATTTGTGHPS